MIGKVVDPITIRRDPKPDDEDSGEGGDDGEFGSGGTGTEEEEEKYSALGSGTVYPVTLDSRDPEASLSDGEKEDDLILKPDESALIGVYNFTSIPAAKDTFVLLVNLWGVWCLAEGGTDIFQAETPETGSWPATDNEPFPGRPGKFKADVYTLDKDAELVKEDATIYNHAPSSPGNNKIVYLKVNQDGSYSIINRVC